MGTLTLKQLKEDNAADDAALEAAGAADIKDEDLNDGKQGEEAQAGNSEEHSDQEAGAAGAGDAAAKGGDEEAGAKASGDVDKAGDITDEGTDNDWMNPDSDSGDGDDTSAEDDKQFGDSDMASVRRKYQTKLKTKEEELQDANDEIERLKTAGTQQQGGLQRPTREQFADEDDPDAAFQVALTQWTIGATEQQQAKNAHESNVKAQREKVQRETTKGVDDHYNRATELGKKSGISNDKYLQVEYSLRGALAQVYQTKGIPNSQDVANSVMDRMIAVIGDGSERVIYKLGIDSKLKAEFQRIADENPDGLATIAFMTSLKERLAPKSGRRSATPKPAKHPAGDKTVKAEEKSLKKAYQDADKSGNLQRRMDARRAAKKAGYDPSNW